MEYIMQKTMIIAVGIVVALIIISTVLFVYQQIVDIYVVVDDVDVSLITVDDEYIRYDDNIMRGVEIYNTLKKNKIDKEYVIVTFNLVRNGSVITLNNSNNWDTYIDYFDGGRTNYVNALSGTYNTSYTVLADQNRIKIDFRAQ